MFHNPELPPIENEQHLEQIRQELMRDIVSGKAKEQYSEWLLRGTLGEVLEITAAVALFPNINGTLDARFLPLTDNP